MRFRESQRPTMAWVWILVLGLAAAAWIVLGGSLLFGVDFGLTPPPPWLAVVLLVVVGVLLPALLMTFRLVTRVDDRTLQVLVIPLLARRTPLDEIAHAEAIRFEPLRDYLGWGLRWMPGKGWCYTARGDRGVRVVLDDGSEFVVGSDRPDELARALGAP